MSVVKIITRMLWEILVSKFVKPNCRVQIGANTYGNPKVVTTHNNRVLIGKFCSIADDVIIVGDNHSYRKVANYPLIWWLKNVKKFPLTSRKSYSRHEENCLSLSATTYGLALEQ